MTIKMKELFEKVKAAQEAQKEEAEDKKRRLRKGLLKGTGLAGWCVLLAVCCLWAVSCWMLLAGWRLGCHASLLCVACCVCGKLCGARVVSLCTKKRTKP